MFHREDFTNMFMRVNLCRKTGGANTRTWRMTGWGQRTRKQNGLTGNIGLAALYSWAGGR
ncbi:hypothetical protein RvY_13278 [Ramazzottius varieornatus]|uniref:Uncharacterized protein n=1 Tax=Ramazzottius varieornatus TaxID=947166 RepID=A0A1D1VMB1_RAMVA|nr:hypothetical protein RvY_13278 [Ramazzottius varieornatus]